MYWVIRYRISSVLSGCKSRKTDINLCTCKYFNIIAREGNRTRQFSMSVNTAVFIHNTPDTSPQLNCRLKRLKFNSGPISLESPVDSFGTLVTITLPQLYPLA